MNLKRVSVRSIFLILIFAVLTSMLVSSAYAYTNDTYGFSITAPAGWTTSEDISGIAVIFYGPTMPETGTDININVIVGTITQTLSEAISSIKTEYPTVFPNYSLVSESSRTIGGLNGYELVYTFSDEGNDYTQKQVVFIENGKNFVITCTAIPSNYDTYLPTFEQSIQTFQLTTTPTPTPTSTPTSTPDEFPLWIVLVAVVIVVVVIAIAIILVYRRGKISKLPIPPP